MSVKAISRTSKLLPRVLVPIVSALGSIVQPERADLVGISNETIGYVTYEKLLAQMKSTAQGRELLRRKPRIAEDTLLLAKSCSPGTLGKMYAEFMEINGFHPEERPPVRFTDGEQLMFVATRAREIHDILHVVFDCPTNLKGELALKAIEFVQYGLPAHWASTYFAASRLSIAERTLLEGRILPWAIRTAGRTPNLICYDFERLFDVQITQVRAKWQINHFQTS